MSTAAAREVDFLVIGSGPAGEKAAALAAYHGKRVVIVERAARPGGTMVAGVASTKTMREAALYLTSFRRRDVYGVGVDISRDLAVAAVGARASEVEAMLTAAAQDNLDRHGIELVHGTARFTGGTGVAVTSATDGSTTHFAAEAVLIATGSRPLHPPGMPFDHPDVLDSETARWLDRAVGTMTVIGGGAVACEYASIFAALGTEVTLVESSGRPLSFMDTQMVEVLTDAFRAMGMRLLIGAGRAGVSVDDEGVRVDLADGETLRPDKVIVAAGRVGNTEDLGLDSAGVEVNDRGLIVVDETFETSASKIYAAGDVTGPPALASVSMEQGRVAACNAFGISFRDSVDSVPPFGVYSIPEAAMVGMTENEARAVGLDVEVGCARLSRNARATISGATEGLVKLVFRRSDGRLVGAHVVGDSATELIHHPQTVIHFGGTVDYFIRATYNVPTETEAFKYAAYDALARLQSRETLTAHV